jgi:phage-related minor tail protein
MADNTANIKAVITADDKASRVLGEFGDNVGNTSRKAALAFAAVGVAVVGFAALSIKAFSESEDKIAQTNAVLKSTGQVAGVTADQVTKLATALQKQTKFSDEDVRSVENLLLTFTSIGKNIFPQATKTVLDMATALGEDTKSASIQLGKALQDPINGITALRRVGVNFNDAQKEVIVNLVNTGQSAKAQTLILQELQKEFGGSAEAAGNTFSGQLAKLKNNLNDVEEAIGGILINVANKFLTAILNWYNAVGGRRTG